MIVVLDIDYVVLVININIVLYYKVLTCGKLSYNKFIRRFLVL